MSWKRDVKDKLCIHYIYRFPTALLRCYEENPSELLYSIFMGFCNAEIPSRPSKTQTTLNYIKAQIPTFIKFTNKSKSNKTIDIAHHLSIDVLIRTIHLASMQLQASVADDMYNKLLQLYDYEYEKSWKLARVIDAVLY